MAGFGRLHETMANLYRGKSSTDGLKPIAENPSSKSSTADDSGRKFESANSNERKQHPAPGSSSSQSRSSAATTGNRSEKPVETDSDEEFNKNTSFSSSRPRRLDAKSPVVPDSIAIDDGAARRRPGSPPPTEPSRSVRRDADQRSSNLSLSPRSSLRVPVADSAGDGERSRSLREKRHYDSTDNMRLGVKDDSSSSDHSDARRKRSSDDRGDPASSQSSSRFRSSLRDEASSLPRRRNFEGKRSEDDLSPPRSSTRDGTSIRRRKEPYEEPFDYDMPVRRGSSRTALTSDSLDEFPSRRRNQLKADRDSPPLRSTSREEPVSYRKEQNTSVGSKEDIPVRRRKILEEDDVPVRHRKELEIGRDSPPLNRRKEPGVVGNKDDIPARRKKIIEEDSDSPPSRVRSHDRPSPRQDVSPPSRSSPRNQSTNRRSNALDTEARMDSLSFNRRRDWSSKSSDAEDLPPRRRRDLDTRSGSPPPKYSTHEEPLNRHRKAPFDDNSESSTRSRGQDSLLRRKPFTEDQGDLNLRRRRNKFDESEDSGRPRASDEQALRRRNVLDLQTGRASSPPPGKSSSARDLSPRLEKSSLKSRSKGRDQDSSSESPPNKRNDGSDLKRSKDLDSKERSSSSLSPLGREVAPIKDDRPKADKAGARSTTSLRLDVPQKGGSGELHSSQSRFRGDKEQPKSGTLKKSVTSPRRDSLEKKKPYSQQVSDSDSASETKGRQREANKSPMRQKSGSRDGRSLSPPARSFSKSSRDDLSPRSRLGKTGTDLKPLEIRSKEQERRDSGKGLSPRSVSKDDNLSPRRSALLADKREDLKLLKSDSKSGSQDDLSFSRQRQLSGRNISPPRTNEQPSLLRDRLKSPSRLSDKEERPFLRRGTRDEETKATSASKSQIELEFSRYESPKLRIVKLKRPLPANLGGTRYALVQEAARHIGFVRTNKDDFKTPFLIWNDTFISTERLTQLQPFQRVNHFPGMAEICRKDLLAKNMEKLNQRYPSEYKFVPRTWCMPGQLAKFRQHVQDQKSELKPSYICKPVDGASGRGIKIYKTADEVPQSIENECVLQEYVSNPFLIENVKFDLRLYVLITSCDPLRVYLFNDGFIRMSSEPYVEPQKCKEDKGLEFMHLTNCAVNKQNRPSDTFDTSRRRVASASGTKRPLMFLNTYLQRNKYDVASVWRKIVDLINKTVFAAYPHIVHSYRQCRPADSPGSSSACFELLGFDILLDADLKPWLVEVNRSPSFDYENSNEQEVKLELLEETLMLLGVSQADWKMANQTTTEGPPASARSPQKDVAELTALLARLKRQDRMKDADSRLCQRFRRIFPVDDAAKQEKLVSQLLDAITALLEGSQIEALLREVKTFHASKTDEVAKKLAQLDSKTAQQLMAEDQAASSDSGSEAEGNQSSRRPLASRLASGMLASKDGAKKPRRKSREKSKDQTTKQPQQSESMTASEREQLAQRTLKFLNELSIRFPGKSHRSAEQLLRQLQDNWRSRKADLSNYWRLSLDADKRGKVIDIARRNVRLVLDKALRMSTSDTAASAADNLARLFEKLYNRLLWCHGQGLWETFGGHAGWELILRQSREAPTDTELNCCRRVVQLCQDCLMVVYLFSDAAQQLEKQQKQDQQTVPEQLQQKSALAAS